MDWTLELIVVPVSDVDRAKAFYIDQEGFNLEVDTTMGPEFRVVQLTPPGSACSIAIGVGIQQMEPGSLHGLHLCVMTSRRPATARRLAGSKQARRSTSARRVGRPGVDPSAGATPRSCPPRPGRQHLASPGSQARLGLQEVKRDEVAA